MRVLGVVPARGGSKGIPRKNLVPVAGRPLLAWTLDAARKARSLARVVVSTDDAEIARVARDHGADVPFVRPAELAGDAARSADVALHALQEVEAAEGRPYDALCLLEPTCPLRTAEDVDAAVALLGAAGADAVVAVARVESPHPYKTLAVEGDELRPFLPGSARTGVPRQDLPPVYAVNGGAYVVRRETLLATRSLHGTRARPYVMPAERSVNVDTAVDVALAELLLRGRAGA